MCIFKSIRFFMFCNCRLILSHYLRPWSFWLDSMRPKIRWFLISSCFFSTTSWSLNQFLNFFETLLIMKRSKPIFRWSWSFLLFILVYTLIFKYLRIIYRCSLTSRRSWRKRSSCRRISTGAIFFMSHRLLSALLPI